MKIKTIDINVNEWFDKVNGNSYFAGTVTLNYGMKDAVVLKLPFQYGYGEHYIDVANQVLQKNSYISYNKYDISLDYQLWKYCRKNNIVLRTHKAVNCRKQDLMRYA